MADSGSESWSEDERLGRLAARINRVLKGEDDLLSRASSRRSARSALAPVSPRQPAEGYAFSGGKDGNDGDDDSVAELLRARGEPIARRQTRARAAPHSPVYDRSLFHVISALEEA